MSRRITILLILLIAVASGALREVLFVNLNYEIDHRARGTEISYAHSAFQLAVESWSLDRLVVVKWLLSGCFVVVMLVLTLWLARILFGSHRRAPIIVLAFAGMGALALLLHGLARQMPPLEAVAVKILHLLQYPVILFVVWAGAGLGGRGAEA
jgi:hypothetical protein